MSIFVQLLQAQHFKLENGGIIQSENHLPGQNGFSLDYRGEAEFNNATVRGHIEANSGSFRGHIEAESGTFSGNVELNMAQYGNVRYPLLGGVRAFARGSRTGGGVWTWIRSPNIAAVNRLNLGWFEIVVTADNLINREFIFCAHERVDPVPNNPSNIWYRDQMTVEFNNGRFISTNPFRILALEFEQKKSQIFLYTAEHCC